MLPAERCDVGKQIVWRMDALGAEVLDGPVEIDGVPVDDGGGEQAEARCAETLVLEGTVADFPLAVEEDGPAQRVAGLALVEAGMAAFAQGRVGQPLQREQGALDPAE